MSAHTPGPWFWADNVPDAPPHYRMIVDADGATVCDPSPMREADARLLAAAPALLEALRELSDYVFDEYSASHPLRERAAEARKLIERATGGAP